MALTMVSVCPLLLPVLGSDDAILMVPVNCPLVTAAGALAGDAAATGEAAGDETADGEETAAGEATATGDAAEIGDAAAAGDAAAGAVVGLGASVGLAGAAVGVVDAPEEQAASNAAPPVRTMAPARSFLRDNRWGRTISGRDSVMIDHIIQPYGELRPGRLSTCP